MAEAVFYEPSEKGWAEIALAPELLAACIAEAERGKVFAESIAPRSDDGDGVPYADSFEVNPIITTDFGKPRVGAELRNTAPHSAAIEFGNKHVRRPHRVLGRTAAFLGEL